MPLPMEKESDWVQPQKGCLQKGRGEFEPSNVHNNFIFFDDF